MYCITITRILIEKSVSNSATNYVGLSSKSNFVKQINPVRIVALN